MERCSSRCVRHSSQIECHEEISSVQCREQGDYTLYAVVRNMENEELACIKVEVIKKFL
jgi:hypothetical protein